MAGDVEDLYGDPEIPGEPFVMRIREFPGAIVRFARGAHVLVKGPSGRIAEGYASGKIVQYEIEAANGDRFMASEHELQAQ